jgi:hypothetical protein
MARMRLVIIDNFDIICVLALPAEAEPPLVVDTNTVLASALSL